MQKPPRGDNTTRPKGLKMLFRFKEESSRDQTNHGREKEPNNVTRNLTQVNMPCLP